MNDEDESEGLEINYRGLNFPVPTRPLKKNRKVKITWEQWMAETADRTREMLKNSPRDPEEELKRKVDVPFVL